MQHIDCYIQDISYDLCVTIVVKSASIGEEHNGKDCVGHHGEKGDKGQDPSL